LSVRFLLDTDICIYIIADAHCRAAARLAAIEIADVGVSAISCAEVLIGARRRTGLQLAAAHLLFERLTILDFDLGLRRLIADCPPGGAVLTGSSPRTRSRSEQCS
jgi:tRNA(fMet)-specific endonuclease VapC